MVEFFLIIKVQFHYFYKLNFLDSHFFQDLACCITRGLSFQKIGGLKEEIA